MTEETKKLLETATEMARPLEPSERRKGDRFISLEEFGITLKRFEDWHLLVLPIKAAHGSSADRATYAAFSYGMKITLECRYYPKMKRWQLWADGAAAGNYCETLHETVEEAVVMMSEETMVPSRQHKPYTPQRLRASKSWREDRDREFGREADTRPDWRRRWSRNSDD